MPEKVWVEMKFFLDRVAQKADIKGAIRVTGFFVPENLPGSWVPVFLTGNTDSHLTAGFYFMGDSL